LIRILLGIGHTDDDHARYQQTERRYPENNFFLLHSPLFLKRLQRVMLPGAGLFVEVYRRISAKTVCRSQTTPSTYKVAGRV
jgi:hypothetical protein